MRELRMVNGWLYDAKPIDQNDNDDNNATEDE